MASDGESRLEKVRAKRMRLRRIGIAALVVLVVGLVAGAGGNLIFAKPKPAAKVVTVPASKKKATTSQTAEPAGGSAKDKKTPAPASARFTPSQAMAHAFALSEQVGVRPAGSVKESAAADYIVGKLGEYGYTVEEQPFTTSDGFSSRNIVGTRQGSKDNYIVVIGAHYDSPGGSKGADDDASGVGTVLELARVFSTRTLEPTLQFVFFGANQPGVQDKDVRLAGSARFVDLLGSLQKNDIVAMIDVDCDGQGTTLALKSQGSGLQRLKDKLETYARQKNQQVSSMKSSADSDNIPFENSQIPAVWIGWCEQDGSVVTDNTYASLAADKVQSVGVLVESFLQSLTSDDLEELKY
ncbi:MAG TPA: M28 family peptidase [Candidatus Anoxymicrobiaceae bacterium]